MRRYRPFLIVLAAAAAAAVTAVPGSAQPDWTLRFSFVPQQAFQGLPAAVSILVKPAAVRCALSVRYADGSLQSGLGETRSASGRAAWKWDMALDAPAGPARAAVHCGRSGSLSRVFTVVGGTVRPSKLQIVAQGFSQRPDSYDSGSAVSYGVVLDNPSDIRDAQNVTVLVNFLDAGGKVLQTATNRAGTIGAAATYNVGGSAQLPTQAPVSRLEVVVQTDGFVKHAFHEPALENVHVVASTFEPDWVGAVRGDVINDAPLQTLTNAQLSIVLFDAAGKVIGGGTGYLLAALPPGTRAFFDAGLGLNSVPAARVSTAAVSIQPTYKAPAP